MDSGYTFHYWGSSGDACLGTSSTCYTASKSAASGFWMSVPNPASDYAGTLDVNGYTGSGSGSGCPGAPVVTLVTHPVQNGYEQAWVNWSDSNGYLSSFFWGTSTSYGNADPQFVSASGSTHGDVNLNPLAQSTTYYFEIIDMNDCGGLSTPYQSSFTTSTASSTTFVGWAFAYQANSSEIDPTGSSISGATFELWAFCPYYYWEPLSGMYFYAGEFLSEFTTTTSSTGSYSFGFPATASPNYIATPQALSLSSAAVCSNGDDSSHTYTNQNYILTVFESGHFNQTVNVSATLSAANDYHKFILPPNVYEPVPLALEYVHTEYAGCGNDFTYTTSSYKITVYSAIAQAATSSTQVGGSSLSEPIVWPTQSYGLSYGLGINFPFSGAVTYSSGSFTPYDGALAPDAHPGPWTTPSPSSDWDTVAPAQGDGNYTPYSVRSIYNSQSTAVQDVIWQGGSWANTSGDGIDVTIGAGNYVNAGVTLSYSEQDTAISGSNVYLGCSLYDPTGGPSGSQGLFYVVEDNSPDGDAPTVHIWYMGWCGATGEQACD
jgi:hypothetical protein